jgi:hypothetical protein
MTRKSLRESNVIYDTMTVALNCCAPEIEEW